MVPALVAELTLDAWTVIIGFSAVVLRYFMQRLSIRKDECVVAFLNGATLVPFVVLVTSAFSPDLLELALTTKGAMALAGGVGIFSVLGEVIAPKDLRRNGKFAIATRGAEDSS
ncbi:hypothetical protein HX870_00530 [Pseudomonas gingeri]|uniref:hypothetical protein n=1 Tax=Pseudomonas gingeri TaxID=117681 RepID=UPI0015A3C566|nr:hypothetical protein [Pseudomonas gingeri]NWA29035.1 hypothetical protein [Pseudomonas gingeri]NWD66105.1 hypothetical protein [Pseudomonas gingeri]NWD73525.1 hypothetical protein [Pseudomonas gingeri]